MTHPALPCPDCDGLLTLKTGKTGPFYSCTTPGCRCTHRAHVDGRPTGTPADKTTRYFRNEAHKVFDAMWQGRSMTRTEAYEWLGSVLGLDLTEAHIGLLNADQCKRLIAAVQKKCGSAATSPDIAEMGRTRLPFGRFVGKQLSHVPPEWLQENLGKFRGALKGRIRQYLDAIEAA